MKKGPTFTRAILVALVPCWASLALCLGVSTPVLAQDSVDTAAIEKTITAHIEKLCRASKQERVALLGEVLEENKIEYRIEDFKRGSTSGKNIVVDVQGKGNVAPTPDGVPQPKWLVLGAHLDRVERGQGAVDNGGGCAALIELIKRLREKPLPNLRITALFFDLEENGLWGSAAYAKALKEKPHLVINMDVFAYGDEVWLYSPQADHPLVKAAEKVNATHPLSFDFAEAYPPSDHLSFLSEKVDAVSFSLLPPDEVDELEKMFGGDRKVRPKILALIHTADDLPSKVNSSQMLSGIQFMEETIRLWHSTLP
jgi:Zn-dependent M28 family amino/carboxypeptidase